MSLAAGPLVVGIDFFLLSVSTNGGNLSPVVFKNVIISAKSLCWNSLTSLSLLVSWVSLLLNVSTICLTLSEGAVVAISCMYTSILRFWDGCGRSGNSWDCDNTDLPPLQNNQTTVHVLI